jgi:hypothetical protein
MQNISDYFRWVSLESEESFRRRVSIYTSGGIVAGDAFCCFANCGEDGEARILSAAEAGAA